MAQLKATDRLAILAGRAATWASQTTGKGSGGMIGGTIALKVAPHIARNIAQTMKVALVTGTNGKSTTTKMLNAALRAHPQASASRSVAWNSRGDNMFEGITSALITSPHATFATLEVDEMHIQRVATHVQPSAFILLNLSRDQLDRVGEIAKVERRIRDTVESYPGAVVIANCDDPLIASAAWDCPHVVWVGAGVSWHADAASFPRTGTRVHFDSSGHWYVPDSPYSRPTPTWRIDADAPASPPTLVTPYGNYPLHLALPGSANLGNAAQAIACAVALGVEPSTAVEAVSHVGEVAGRYAHYAIDGKEVRMLLAKNPAGWQEALTMIDPHAGTVVFAVNGQVADSVDLSWIWDVDFENALHLPPHCEVIVAGERAEDLLVRLRYAGITARLERSPWKAIHSAAPSEARRIELLANYTAFRDLTAYLKKAGYTPPQNTRHDPTGGK
ncbi:MAG: MurT ligase domain-containing protein [Actinomycetaceae bacterium]|nr:MurT ligase domain-containing protein [Arcanobacterium sp.]MDD7505477.1 MurT ligase domain-containing protein [Actinomycetaceae bacterium]MDY6143163.1 MurT ligase domain-containing protein [Arcanobacterium sp.]